jgi:Helix-turn-helix domain
MSGNGVALQIDPESLRPLIEQVVEATAARLEEARATAGDRLAYSEPEAARLLGLQPHQLRDERLRGRIRASAIVGRRIRYLRADLMEYLLSRRWSKDFPEK